MALKNLEGNINVVEAARNRITNIFDSNVPVRLSTSGGKDSLCLCHLTYELLLKKRIKPDQLIIQFIDEEAMFDDVIDIVKDWRKRFMELGVGFEWYCIPVKHFNCLNSLDDVENWILWDEMKKDVWVRERPDFAITSHPLLRKGKDNYQSFLCRINMGTISLIGIRYAESLHRRENLAKISINKKNTTGITGTGFAYPIYDWDDRDVWLYLLRNKIDYPQTYINLYQIGTSVNRLRISQFFSIDTAKSLVQLNEFDSTLMERVVAREPNAYLATLYWDTEFFRRSRKSGQKDGAEIDWKKKVMRLFIEKEKHATGTKVNSYRRFKGLLIKEGLRLNNNTYKRIYDSLVAGDPKDRSLRGIIKHLSYEYAKNCEKEKRQNERLVNPGKECQDSAGGQTNG